jgi:RNA-directed DNA polymerase
LARWIGLPIGKVAWLVHRFAANRRPESVRQAHYHYRWCAKRSGGSRLIEAPKQTLKGVQELVLREILDHVPPHPAAHGFVAGRSIVTNARPLAGRRVVVKFDLENFYAGVSFARVTAIFRGLGYSREAALWLAQLTTSAVPHDLPLPEGGVRALRPYLRRHLPQGAPTSPALANLSTYSLDVRLSGMARAFGASYTRYADDIAFSGPESFLRALPVFIPLATQIIRSERFRVNAAKRKVVRNGSRQVIAGVVVNEKPNVSRREFDRLKAILTNCLRHGPASQNRDAHADFAAHLRGRVAHVTHVNPARGAKLLGLYEQIDWRR